MSEDNRDGEDQIEDPEQIVQARRLNSIFDIRDELREYRKIILMESYDNHGITRFQALSGYRTLANNYLMELQPLLEKFDKGEELLTEKDFGYATIQPPDDAEDPQIKQVELIGLESIWTVPDPLKAEYRVEVYDNINKTNKMESTTTTDQFAPHTTDKFIREMNRFLSVIGFELEPQQNSEDAEFDYSDLI
jgi:hypothetical protein